MLNEIKEILEDLCKDADVPMETADYGMCTHDDLTNWNYFVFNRANISKSGTSQKGFSEYYEVNIVHEDYIPEDYIYKVISEIEKKSDGKNKLKQADKDIDFNYIKKNNTDLVVEIATITFVHAAPCLKERLNHV